MAWLSFIRPGDWLLILIATLVAGGSFPLLWQGGKGERVVIRLDGQVFLETSLSKSQEVLVPGSLGSTKIQIEPGRARVVADPGPRQYCVRQGWLSQAGEIAICAPNRVSLSIVGANPSYDSLNY